jgi:mannose/fructose/N-acetylgalactosamine-specific phosphotransferase system component IIC
LFHSPLAEGYGFSRGEFIPLLQRGGIRPVTNDGVFIPYNLIFQHFTTFFKNLSEIFVHLFGEFAKQALAGQKGVKLERWIFFLPVSGGFFRFVKWFLQVIKEKKKVSLMKKKIIKVIFVRFWT